MSGTVLEARDVRKAYRGHQVLAGVDLAVRPGQLAAVVGENGAGKSTLLKILAGTLAADGGQVRLAGTLGYCPQDPVLNDNLTVGQHLRYFAAARRLPSLRLCGGRHAQAAASTANLRGSRNTTRHRSSTAAG